jgi:hypothetical protein
LIFGDKQDNHDNEKKWINAQTVNVHPDVVGIVINHRRLQFVNINGNDGQNMHCHDRQTTGRQADQFLTGDGFLSLIFNLGQASGNRFYLMENMSEARIFSNRDETETRN